MAGNEINLTIKVTDKGNLKIVGQNAEKAAAGLDKAGKSARTTDRNLKGASQQSANGTKNFSKMAQGISGGLVPAYATLAANVFAVSAAFSFFKDAADLRVVQESQENYARSTGTSLSLLTSRIQEATDGVLTFQEAAQAVSIGTASGLNSEQLSGLANVAKNASLALGRDLSDSFDRLVRGATKAEPELLDELGIILRLETATEKYGASLNKNAKDLTAYQRTQAVVNEILEQGNQKFDDLGGQVNKVAKLGKAFNDLLKDIKGALNPIAEFFAGALANNVLALAGAFTLLGQGILKAIVPVAPALEDIGEAAEAATKRIQAALPDDPSALGKNIAKGDIGGREIAALERSTTAASSKVVDYSKTTQKAVSRDVAIIKARHEAMIAANTSGFKRYVASAKAELFSLQATHGKVMGTMTAAANQFGRIASKIIGAAGLIGLLFTALGIIRELLEKLKDPALLKALELTKAVREAAAEQNEAVSDILSNLVNKSGTVQESIVDLANAISNLDFSGYEKLELVLENIGKNQLASPSGIVQTALDLSKTNVSPFVDSVEELRESLVLQIATLSAAGKDTKLLRERYAQLTTTLTKAREKIEEVQRAQIAPDEGGLREILAELLGFTKTLPGELKKTSAGLVDQGAAFKSLKQIGEEYSDFTSSLTQTNTEFSRSMKITKDAIDSVTGAMAGGNQDQAFLKVFQDAEGGEAILRILEGMTQEERERITVREVLAKLQEKNNRLLKIENDVLLQQTKTQILKEKSMRNLTPLQKGLLDNEFKQRNILDEIAKIQGQKSLLTEEEIAQDSSRVKELDLQLQLLREQLETVRQQNNAMLELSNSAKGAFEGATQGGIAELIKGDESSIKDAMLKIAKATLSAVADTLAKQITEKITGALFGTPEDKIRQAHMEGAEVVKQKIKEGHQEGLAVDGKVATPTTATNIISEVKNTAGKDEESVGIMEKLFGRKTTGKVTVGNETEGYTESSKTRRTGGIFSGFINAFSDVFDKNIEGGFLEKMGAVFQEGGSLFADLFKSLPDLLGSLFGGAGGGGIGGLFSLFFANGGIAKGGFRSAAYANGGIAKSPTVGLVGEGKYNEAIVPLPDGKSIPVSMGRGMGQQNNVTVNVSIDGNGNTNQNSEGDQQGMDLGKVIASAVQQELLNQKRQGGILNPNGVS